MARFKLGDTATVVPFEGSSSEFPVGSVVTAVEVEADDYDGSLSANWMDSTGRTAWLYDEEIAVLHDTAAFDLLSAITGTPLKFRSGCEVKFVAYVKDAKPHCQLVLLNPATGNVVTRYANGKSSTETYDEPGDILVVG
jgi:hypothetical protein